MEDSQSFVDPSTNGVIRLPVKSSVLLVVLCILFSASVVPQEDGRSEGIATEAAWEHVRSLYQSTSSTCLFGKNNIMVQPVSGACFDSHVTIHWINGVWFASHMTK